MTVISEVDERITETALKHELHGSALLEPSLSIHGEQGTMFAMNEHVPYYPACTIKVPLCVAAYMLIARGELTPGTVTVSEEQVTESVVDSPIVAGAAVEFSQLVHYALYYSDNTAANVLLDIVGRERGTSLLQSIGLKQTALRRWLVGQVMKPDPLSTGRNAHSAGDAAKLLAMLANNELPFSREILSGLAHPNSVEMSQFGLKKSDRFYYKEGYTSSVLHFCCIIENGDGVRRVIALYTNLGFSAANYAKVQSFIADMRQILY